MPEFVAPQLATLMSEPPSGDQWLHELKFDGYRMLCHLHRGKARFWSRNGKDWTAKFPNLSEALKQFPATSAILDGEVVIVDKAGRTSFQLLQQAMGKGGRFGPPSEFARTNSSSSSHPASSKVSLELCGSASTSKETARSFLNRPAITALKG